MPRKAGEIQELLRSMLEKGWLERTIPDKPRSRLQWYRTTEAGLAMLDKPARRSRDGTRPLPASEEGRQVDRTLIPLKQYTLRGL
jgi:hypothetical protein